MRMTQFQLGTVRTSDRMVRRSNPASGYPLADDPHIASKNIVNYHLKMNVGYII